MNTINIIIDLTMIIAGFFANRKWKDEPLGVILMIGGGLMLFFDLLGILFKNLN